MLVYNANILLSLMTLRLNYSSQSAHYPSVRVYFSPKVSHKYEFITVLKNSQTGTSGYWKVIVFFQVVAYCRHDYNVFDGT